MKFLSSLAMLLVFCLPITGCGSGQKTEDKTSGKKSVDKEPPEKKPEDKKSNTKKTETKTTESKNSSNQVVDVENIDVKLHAKDLKRLVELAKEGQKLSRKPGVDRSELEPFRIESFEIISRITKIDPEKTPDEFRRAAEALLKKAAKTYDPEFYNKITDHENSQSLIVLRSHYSDIFRAMRRFRRETKKYPTTEQGLKILTAPRGEDRFPYIDPDESDLFIDPWGHPLVYSSSEDSYTLFSLGPDGKEGTPDDAHHDLERSYLKQVDLSLYIYRIDNKKYPTAEQGLKILTLPEPDLLNDHWGNPIIYRPSGDGYKLLSLGKDGKEGTADDVHLEK